MKPKKVALSKTVFDGRRVSAAFADQIASFGASRWNDGYVAGQQAEKNTHKLDIHRLTPLIIAVERAVDCLTRLALVYAKADEKVN